jgi:hypothetical protein
MCDYEERMGALFQQGNLFLWPDHCFNTPLPPAPDPQLLWLWRRKRETSAAQK